MCVFLIFSKIPIVISYCIACRIVQFFISQLEVRLGEKEEQMLEKDLIFDQVSRLADRVKNKAESGQGDTLKLAKKVR